MGPAKFPTTPSMAASPPLTSTTMKHNETSAHTKAQDRLVKTLRHTTRTEALLRPPSATSHTGGRAPSPLAQDKGSMAAQHPAKPSGSMRERILHDHGHLRSDSGMPCARPARSPLRALTRDGQVLAPASAPPPLPCAMAAAVFAQIYYEMLLPGSARPHRTASRRAQLTPPTVSHHGRCISVPGSFLRE